MPLKYSTQIPVHWSRATFEYPATQILNSHSHLILEIGPGRGDFLFHLAEENPDATIVGIEIKPKRVDKLIARIERRGLKNISLIQDDARCALPRRFADGSVDEIHINFPDPWPKKRHSKNRALTTEFLRECARVLKTGGFISIATDHEQYAQSIAEAAACVEELVENRKDETEPYPTLFAIKWKNEGRRIVRMRYGKRTF